MRLPRGAPVPDDKEGVGETSSLADALSFSIHLILRSRALARRLEGWFETRRDFFCLGFA